MCLVRLRIKRSLLRGKKKHCWFQVLLESIHSHKKLIIEMTSKDWRVYAQMLPWLHQNVALLCLCLHAHLCVCLPSQLFKGKFYYCVGFDVKNITNKSDCLAANYRWVHHKYNFDNLGQVRESENLLFRTYSSWTCVDARARNSRKVRTQMQMEEAATMFVRNTHRK